MTKNISNYAAAQERLLHRRSELQQRKQRVEHDLARADQPLEQDFAEQAVQLQNDEALNAIAASAQEELSAIDFALQRIASGQYGRCTICNGLIEAERLQAVPYAESCRECAQSAN
jgi:RNA polymerase-binding transcription factor DksA